jgi:hypothetical protein
MSRHLKNIVIDRLKSTIATFEQLPAGSTPHSKGVRYFRANTGIDMFWGAMDMVKEGQARKKRIIVRPSRFRSGLFELYTYHFPKHWSAACVANRELIKEAQRQAHALEHDHSLAALEWRTRFLHHYYTVFKGGAKPEPGLKPYSRFYQYTYVAIYRQLQAELQAAKEKAALSDTYLQHLAEEVSFEPVILRPTSLHRHPLHPSVHHFNISPFSKHSLRHHYPLPSSSFSSFSSSSSFSSFPSVT